MVETLSKQASSAVVALEENLLDWNEVLKNFKTTFGNDVYESWLKNINLKKEFNHYVVLTAPTRFVRDWIVSRYADKILDVVISLLVATIPVSENFMLPMLLIRFLISFPTLILNL